MVFRESQVLAALERHREVAPEPLRVQYAFPISLAERRLRLLEAALVRRGVRADGAGTGVVRAIGRVIGSLTSWGGRQRILSVDIEGVKRLLEFYLAEYGAGPPPEIARMLAGFVGELEAERCALLAESRRASSR